MIVSIFNDVIGPVMRGPSSSHCAAALRIGRLARDLMDGEFDDVLVEFDRNGSLPTTHETQGSDMGLFGGLMGWDAADERLARFAGRRCGSTACDPHRDRGCRRPASEHLPAHACRTRAERHSLIAISTGGGMMEVLSVDGFNVSMFGDCFETLLWVESRARTAVEKLGALDAGRRNPAARSPRAGNLWRSRPASS